ncbi:hypothetical protein ACSHUI_00835 [Bacillus subtilis]|uniref:hypothetical protein n=1 Tax=Bacillus subtilis TaxID=1423 RepID=UPI003CE9A6E4
MIQIPEITVKRIIEKGLQQLQSNPDAFDKMFATADLTTRSRIKSLFAKTVPNVVLGYPLEQSSVPTYVITLGQDLEEEHSIGNQLGEDEVDFLIASEPQSGLVKVFRDRETGNYHVKTTIRPIESVESIYVTAEDETHFSGFSVVDEVKGIIDVTALDVSIYDTLEVAVKPKTGGFESFGSMFTTTLNVETWTTNGDLTICMYTILKYILLAAKDEMYKQGFIDVKLAGGDLQFNPEYSPERVYSRMTTITFKLESSIDNEYGFLTEIFVNGTLEED